MKLVDGLAGESPASASYPVGTVVISGDGEGDQTFGSPDVNALVGLSSAHEPRVIHRDLSFVEQIKMLMSELETLRLGLK